MHLHVISSNLSFLLMRQFNKLVFFVHACSSLLQMTFRNERAQADVALGVNNLDMNKMIFFVKHAWERGDPPLSLCPSSPWPPPCFRLCPFFPSERQSSVRCPQLHLFPLVASPCHQSSHPHLTRTLGLDHALNSQAASLFLLLSWFSHLSAEIFCWRMDKKGKSFHLHEQMVL